MEPRELSVTHCASWRIREMHYPAGYRQERHAHDEPQVSVILRGTMEETVGGLRRTATVGDLVFKPRGTTHENLFLTSGGVRILCIDTADTSALPAVRYGLEQRAGALGYALRIREGREGVEELLALLPSTERRDCALVSRATRLIEERLDQPVSLGTLAAELGVHRIHLARQFRRIRGCSVGEHIRALRVRLAAGMIGSSRSPLSEVALACGFADQAHMTRLFRAASGMTPRAFRTLLAD
jgi:AraC family transcriptional regulator